MLILPSLNLGYFLGSKDRSQQTRLAPCVKVSFKSPWFGTVASAKVSMSICPFIASSNLIQTSSKCVRHGLKIWALSRVGLIIPSLG